MRHEERSKKDERFADERIHYQPKSTHKKKKLKPVEKVKYRIKAYSGLDEQED